VLFTAGIKYARSATKDYKHVQHRSVCPVSCTTRTVIASAVMAQQCIVNGAAHVQLLSAVLSSLALKGVRFWYSTLCCCASVLQFSRLLCMQALLCKSVCMCWLHTSSCILMLNMCCISAGLHGKCNTTSSTVNYHKSVVSKNAC
jgi:hypothetical protein